jgi:hypothetical protein
MLDIPSGDARPPFVRGPFIHMTFDDQLHRAFDTLTDRLHDDLRRHVQVAVDALATAHAEREAEQSRDVEIARAGAAEEIAAVRAEAAAEIEAAKVSAAREIDALHATLARELDAALEASAAREAEAVAQVRATAAADADAAAKASAAALEGAVAAAREHAMSGARVAAGDRLLDAVRSIGRARSLSETLDALVGCAAREAERAAVFTVRGNTLHGWRFIGFGVLDDDPRANVPSDGRGLASRARETRNVAADDRGCAVPIALAADVVAVLYAEDGDPIALELLARHAERSIEALVAFKAARAVVNDLRPSGEPPSPAGRDDEDVAARRYARLLVSEIRLYHEPEIAAGRRERNLSARLGGEIARARSLYEQRIPSHVRQHAPYFDEELVRTLADGDSTLL